MTSPKTTRPRTMWDQSDDAGCRRAARVLEVVGQRWTPGVLFALARGAERFTEIIAAVPGISARMLTVRLKQLEKARLVERTVIPTTPVSVLYHLTPRGTDLLVALQPMADYLERWDDGSDEPD